MMPSRHTADPSIPPQSIYLSAASCTRVPSYVPGLQIALRPHTLHERDQNCTCPRPYCITLLQPVAESLDRPTGSLKRNPVRQRVCPYIPRTRVWTLRKSCQATCQVGDDDERDRGRRSRSRTRLGLAGWLVGIGGRLVGWRHQDVSTPSRCTDT